MIDQASILRILAASEGPVSLEDICRQLDPAKPAAPRTQRRRNIIGCLGKMITNKHVARVEEARRFPGNAIAARYILTSTGKAFVAAGGTVKRKGAEPGPRDPLPNSIRQRIWTAFRMAGKSTLGELAELIHQEGDPAAIKVTDNARKYFKGLCRVGIAVQMRGRQPGNAPTSNGHVRFGLVTDVGPKAPVVGAKDVFDPNARKRIPYKTEKSHAG